MPELTEWATFYLIVASAAGALIGLRFVVITSSRKARHCGSRRLALHCHGERRSFRSRIVVVGDCKHPFATGSAGYRLSGVLWASAESFMTLSWLGG